MISANRIEFRNHSSLDFDLYVSCAFDSDEGETDTYLTREAVASESYRGEFKRIHNFKYTETFNPKFTFIKNDFSDFTLEETRKVLKWLTGSSNASFLSVYEDDSNVLDFEILGGFSDISLYKLGNGRTVGIVATFESAFPYALSPLKTITKDVSDPTDNVIKIDIDSDEPESVVYPRVTIQQNSSPVIQINHAMTDSDEWLSGCVYHYDGIYYWTDIHGKHNLSTNNSEFETTGVVITNTYIDDDKNTKQVATKIINNIPDETVILDGANKVVLSNRSGGRIFGDDFIDWTWLPLFDGENTISVTGNCIVTLEYRTPVKCGEY